MIKFSTLVDSASSVTYSITLYDEDGDATTPTGVTWTLGDTKGNTINSRDDVVGTPGNPTEITLTPSDTKYSDGPDRELIVKFTYNSTYGLGQKKNGSIEFSIRDLYDVD